MGRALRRRARLAGLRALGRLAGRATMPAAGSVERVLVIRPDHLGDVVMTTAVLCALREASPAAEIVALIGPWGGDLLRGNRDVDRVLLYPFPWFDRRSGNPADPYVAATRLAARLRAELFSRAYVLRSDHWWGAMAAALAGIPGRVGYGTAECQPFLTRSLPPPGREHAVVSALRLVAGEIAADTAEPGRPPTAFCLTPADRAAAAARLVAAGLAPGERYVIVHPGASTPLKRWPADRWASVVDAIAGRGERGLLVGGPGEETMLDDIAGRVRLPAARIPAAPSLGELAALLERARYAVGMDSAPMHLATAVGTPTLRLYGPGDEVLFGPWGDPRRHRVVRAPGSRPDPEWFGRAGGRHPTLQALDVETVLAELARLREAIG